MRKRDSVALSLIWAPVVAAFTAELMLEIDGGPFWAQHL